MTFTICTDEQRSAGWFAARAGRVTGSKAKEILANGKSGAEAVTRRDYRCQLLAERLTGQPQEDSGFVSDAMRWGVEQEANAFAAYEAHSGHLVAGVVPSEHLAQIVHNLYVTDALWCDFVSFDPRLPAPLQLFVVRHMRDEKQIASYQLALSLFLSEVEVEVFELRKRMELAVA